MKYALITGASGGLGSCLVREYLERGYYVFGADLRETDPLRRIREEFPEQFQYIEMNTADDRSVDTACGQVELKTASLDILINGAAILLANSANLLEQFDITASMDTFNINSLGPLRTVKRLLPLLKAGGDKVIVNISSEAGSMTTHCDYINRYDYCMSKAALNIQSIILQRYLRPDGFRVLAIHPGWMRTEMGGPEAPVLPADSAKGIAGLAQNCRSLPEDGIYFDYDGQPRPW